MFESSGSSGDFGGSSDYGYSDDGGDSGAPAGCGCLIFLVVGALVAIYLARVSGMF